MRAKAWLSPVSRHCFTMWEIVLRKATILIVNVALHPGLREIETTPHGHLLEPQLVTGPQPQDGERVRLARHPPHVPGRRVHLAGRPLQEGLVREVPHADIDLVAAVTLHHALGRDVEDVRRETILRCGS